MTFESLFANMKDTYGVVINPPTSADQAKYKKYALLKNEI
jgi:hypothetical protein